MNFNSRRGLTLIEILVVVSIFSILGTVVYFSGSDARANARDRGKITTLKQTQLALDTFYERYGAYPCGNAPLGFPAGTPGAQLSCSSTSRYVDGLDDPGAGGYGICNEAPFGGLQTDNLIGTPEFDDIPHKIGYVVSPDRQQYVLTVELEKDVTLMANDGGQCNNYYEIGPWKDDVITPSQWDFYNFCSFISPGSPVPCN